MQNFAVLSFSYSLPLCILKRIRETDDCASSYPCNIDSWPEVMPGAANFLRLFPFHFPMQILRVMMVYTGKNHTAAGVMSGFVISWGNGPINMLGSSLLLGAISGYLSRSDPTVAHAATSHTNPDQVHSSEGRNCKAAQSQHRSNSVAQLRSLDHTETTDAEDLLRCAATWASTCGHDNQLMQSFARGWHGHGVHAAQAVWSALKPGCRSCTVQHTAEESMHQPVSASLRKCHKEPRGLRAASSSNTGSTGAPARGPRDSVAVQ